MVQPIDPCMPEVKLKDYVRAAGDKSDSTPAVAFNNSSHYHKDQAKGSQIVEHPEGNSEDQSRAFRDAQEVVAARVREQLQGIYDASSDSIVFPKSEDQVKAEVEIEAADRILEFYHDTDPKKTEDLMGHFINQGVRVMAVGQPDDSPTPNGEYVTGEAFHRPHVPKGVINQYLLGFRDVQRGDIWFAKSRVWNGVSWLTYEEWEKEYREEAMQMAAEKLKPAELSENDPVNHPSHYTAYPGIEVIQLTRWLGFNKGNAVKYIARAGLKSTDTKEQDLEKAIWYLKDELATLRGENGTFEG